MDLFWEGCTSAWGAGPTGSGQGVELGQGFPGWGRPSSAQTGSWSVQGGQRGSLLHLGPRWPGSTPIPHPARAWPLPPLACPLSRGLAGKHPAPTRGFWQREDKRSVGTGGPLWGPGGRPLPLPLGLRQSRRKRLGGGCWAGGSPGRGQQLPSVLRFLAFRFTKASFKRRRTWAGCGLPVEAREGELSSMRSAEGCPATLTPWCLSQWRPCTHLHISLKS